MGSSTLRKIDIRKKKGQTLVEYSLVLVCVSLVAIGVMSAMGSQVKGAFTNITSQLSSANSSGGAPVPPPRGG
jgi:Flp pilus assembly pilin Flp